MRLHRGPSRVTQAETRSRCLVRQDTLGASKTSKGPGRPLCEYTELVCQIDENLEKEVFCALVRGGDAHCYRKTPVSTAEERLLGVAVKLIGERMKTVRAKARFDAERRAGPPHIHLRQIDRTSLDARSTETASYFF